MLHTSQENLITNLKMRADYWHNKYLKEHARKKKLNKLKKKSIKQLKKRTKQVKILSSKIKRMNASAFLREHDYF